MKRNGLWTVGKTTHVIRPPSQRGMSMVELIVTMGILGLMVAITMPTLNSSMVDLPVAEQSLISDIRLARAYATTRGVHYQVSISAGSYSVQRLQDADGDGEWDPDSSYPPHTVELPSEISFSQGAGSVIEFTVRGLLRDQSDGTPAEIVTIQVHDSLHTETKTIEVWPSGQVEEV